MFRRTRVGLAAAMAVGGLAAIATDVALAQEAQRVEITGSSIRRIDAETALPVEIITREEIQRSGVQNVEQLMQSISAVSGQGATLSATGVGNSTYGQSSISL